MRKLTTPARAVLILLFLSLLENGKSATPDPLDSWEQDYPFIDVQNLIYSNDRFWFGAHTGIYSSSDGQAWRKELGHYSPPGSLIAYGNNRFVAIADSQIFLSTNGSSWQAAPISADLPRGAIQGLVFGNGRFVAGTRLLHSSEDGIHWQTTLTNIIVDVLRLSFLQDRFVAFGSFEEAVSTDGLHWERYRSSPTNRIPHFAAAAHGPAGDIGVTDVGALYSFALTNDFMAITNATPKRIMDIGYFGNQFIAVGFQSSNGIASVSRDGFTWGPETELPGWLDRVTYGGGRYLAAGFDTIVTSVDGVKWNNERMPSVTICSFAASSNVLIAAGASNPNALPGNISPRPGAFVMTTHDGRSWKWLDSGKTNAMRSILFDGQKFVAVGEHGRTATSIDGEAWDEHESGLDVDLQSIAFAHDNYVATGFSLETLESKILASADGEHWRVVAPPPPNPTPGGNSQALQNGTTSQPLYRAIAAGDDRFVLVGPYAGADGGVAMISTNGENWKTVPTFARFGSISFGNGVFVACGSQGAVGISTNGEAWQISSLGNSVLPNVTFAGGIFLTSDGKQIWSSKDGRLWKSHNLPSPGFGSPQVFAFWNRSWYGGGRLGLLLTSGLVRPHLTIFASSARQSSTHLKIEDDLNGAVTLERSLDLEAWVTVTNSAVTPFELDDTPAKAEKAFYRARIRGN